MLEVPAHPLHEPIRIGGIPDRAELRRAALQGGYLPSHDQLREAAAKEEDEEDVAVRYDASTRPGELRLSTSDDPPCTEVL
jgi:hypothetical protein